ncbi:MAG: ATP-binding protein [Thermoanaerobaculia bacterium]
MRRSLLDMQIDTVTWDDVKAFLAQDESDMRLRPPEGSRLDFKSAGVDDAGKTVVAFANTHGGWILFGVKTNEKTEKGDGGSYPIDVISVVPRLEEQVVSHILATVRPRPPIRSKLVAGDGKAILLVHVDFGDDCPYVFMHRSAEHVYVRRGDADRMATREEIVALVGLGDRRRAAEDVGNAPIPVSSRLQPFRRVQGTGRPNTHEPTPNAIRLVSYPVPQQLLMQGGDDEERFMKIVKGPIASIMPETRLWGTSFREFDATLGDEIVRWRLEHRGNVGLGLVLDPAGAWDLGRTISLSCAIARVTLDLDAALGWSGRRMIALDHIGAHVPVKGGSFDALIYGAIDERPLDARFNAIGTGSVINTRFGARVAPAATGPDWLAALTDLWLPVLRERAWYRGSRDQLALFVGQCLVHRGVSVFPSLPKGGPL